jgi:multiple sugar transport system substrate-binding protein
MVTAMAGVLVAIVGACSPAASSAPSTGPGTAGPTTAAQQPVTISVGVLRPGATQEAVDALNLQVTEFQAKYPWITVQPEEYNWTAPTFTAALAAGTLPDVFTIPFKDG